MTQDLLDDTKKRQPWYVNISRMGSPNDNWLLVWMVVGILATGYAYFLAGFWRQIIFITTCLLASTIYAVSYYWLKKNDQLNN